MTVGSESRRGLLKATGAAILSLAGASRSRAVTDEMPSGIPPNGHFDVRNFGATGDGKTLDTPAINKAIETAASAGGGTVYFAAGTYLSLIHI